VTNLKLHSVAVLVAFACACANGYDGEYYTALGRPKKVDVFWLMLGSLIGSISAMHYFKQTFGTSLYGIKLAGISSLYNV
jgi:hypothetical protein